MYMVLGLFWLLTIVGESKSGRWPGREPAVLRDDVKRSRVAGVLKTQTDNSREKHLETPIQGPGAVAWI